MASINGCFYLENGSYIEVSITEHNQRKKADSEYTKRRFISTEGGYLLEMKPHSLSSGSLEMASRYGVSWRASSGLTTTRTS